MAKVCYYLQTIDTDLPIIERFNPISNAHILSIIPSRIRRFITNKEMNLKYLNIKQIVPVMV